MGGGGGVATRSATETVFASFLGGFLSSQNGRELLSLSVALSVATFRALGTCDIFVCATFSKSQAVNPCSFHGKSQLKSWCHCFRRAVKLFIFTWILSLKWHPQQVGGNKIRLSV